MSWDFENNRQAEILDDFQISYLGFCLDRIATRFMTIALMIHAEQRGVPGTPEWAKGIVDQVNSLAPSIGIERYRGEYFP